MADEATPSGLNSFVAGFAMIMFSEIGDRTFLSNCVMAMKHDRKLVFFAAMGALALMSILSAILGYTLPALISKQYTQYLAIVLFFVFGGKMFMEAKEMSHNQAQEELEEVNKELMTKNEIQLMDNLESGGVSSSLPKAKETNGWVNLCNYIFSPTFVQIFTITFLAEWGDRSQIGTVILAASQHPFWVILGSITGHSVCTALAVMCGKFLASRISVKTVTYFGACLFMGFGVYTVFEAIFFTE